ncbi:hypothetical protein JCM19237_1342 [Photobacterium aphoticum]|uniref:Uncharacterized protein n=1 Tax=Photobacterium aphoticum TaxID=754436 RepID=A0A090QND4_9GAMM|nr:hypothetical protein JCM19237_1342 [Photobacterium aphoticum]
MTDIPLAHRARDMLYMVDIYIAASLYKAKGNEKTNSIWQFV